MMKSLPIITLVGALVFGALVVSLHFLRPDLPIATAGLSNYALGPYGHLMQVGFVAIGLAGLSFGVYLLLDEAHGASAWGPILLIGWALLSMVAAVFPVDAPGATPTTAGAIHNLAGMNFLLIASAAVILAAPKSRRVGYRQVGPAWLARLLLTSAILLVVFMGPLRSVGIGGIVQRLYWLLVLVWLLSSGTSLFRSRSAGPTQDEA
jgi:hypothetical protein